MRKRQKAVFVYVLHEWCIYAAKNIRYNLIRVSFSETGEFV